MGVRDLVVRWAVRRPHVLPVEVPGQWRLRALLDHELALRDWPVASSPADADILAVCGRPGPQLSSAVDVVWDQMPGPRVRTPVTDGDRIGAALDDAVAALRDTHRDDPREPGPPRGDEDSGESHMESHSDMAPAGIPLAEGAEDRDGLEMDVLHVRLGPILPRWPGGFVLCCELHGDVIAGAEALRLDAGQYPAAGGHRMSATSDDNVSAARQCDHILDVLDLAGWPGAAERARRARDALLAGTDPAETAALLDDLELAVRRSHVLRWSLRGLATLSPEDLRRRGLPATWAGDAHDRLLRRITHARESIAPEVIDADTFGSLPDIVAGLDVAAARVVIAGLGIDAAGHATR
ncbi:hypothetical protein [Mycolicibacterium poriferae]|uniref:hypothetical protein n=1 Tax=Mycolicibacterium poriferae TaxID=39694 RepID=UPI00321C34B0